jgi:hypothetical protein
MWEDAGKMWGKVNMVKILHILHHHVSKWKYENCWKCSKNGGKWDKWERMMNFGKCTLYHQYNNNNFKKIRKEWLKWMKKEISMCILKIRGCNRWVGNIFFGSYFYYCAGGILWHLLKFL